MPTRTVEVPGGARIFVREAGRGPTVLFLHAFPLSSALWEREVEIVANLGRRATAFDFRGFGASSGPKQPGSVTTMETLADDALAVLDALGIDRTALVCCSMGGYVAFPLVARAPKRVTGVVLESTRFTADTEEVRRGRLETADKVEREGVEVLVREMLPRLLSPQPDPAVQARAAQMVRSGSAFGLAAALRGMAARADHRGTCSSLRVPALVVGGSQDPVTTPVEIAALADAIPGAQRIEITGVGHLANLEAPDKFGSALARFIQALPA